MKKKIIDIGSCVPKYNIWNNNGQILLISDNNDIVIYYSYEKDTRSKKINFPEFLKKPSKILIAIWTSEKMKFHINNKFNKKGFFICEKINNKFENIYFGDSFNFDYFIESIKNRSVYFDSGLYEGNNRNYSMFRASFNKFWDGLLIK